MAQAKSDFSFLEEAAGRAVEVDDGAWRTVLAFVVGSITIEVELDWQARCAFVLICRTVDGGRPPGYYMHDGRRMRVQFAEALDRGNENDRAAARRVRSVTRKSGPEAMSAQLRETSAILRGQGAELESYYAELFTN